MPGIFAQTVVFGSTFTAVGLAEDMTKGFIDRLRSLPISQPAVLIGRTISDLLRNLLTFAVMLAVAFAIGFRFEGGLVRGILATLLLLYFSFAFSWIQALIGMSVKSVEAANSAGFIWMFPMTFMSSAFVSTETMTPWLRRVANANPFTIATDAARALYNGRDPGDSLWQALALGDRHRGRVRVPRDPQVREQVPLSPQLGQSAQPACRDRRGSGGCAGEDLDQTIVIGDRAATEQVAALGGSAHDGSRPSPGGSARRRGDPRRVKR